MEEKEKREIIYEYVFGYEPYEMYGAPDWMSEMAQKIEAALYVINSRIAEEDK